MKLLYLQHSNLPVSILGGKGWNLKRLLNAGCVVPETLVLTSQDLDEFRHNVQRAFSDEQLKEIWSTDKKKALAIIQLLQIEVMNYQCLALDSALASNSLLSKWLATGVIVRSSAVAEDTKNNSFAGCYKSIAGITDLSHLSTAIKNCWGQRYSPTVLSYLAQSSSRKLGGLALLIQPLLSFSISGVLFSKNPITNDSSQMMISVVNGSCSAVVDGQDCATYTVDRESRTLMLAPGSILPGVDTTRLVERTFPILYNTALHVEQVFGAPVDIEWGLGSNGLIVLQARPITT